MPRYAMLTAHPDYVLRVPDMPAALTRYIAHNYVKARQPNGGEPTETDAAREPALAAFVELLKSGTGQDFGAYKTGTLQRRIERRMALHGIEGLADYLALLRKSPAEIDGLARDLLINVTGFFRDPEAFDSVAEQLPRILSNHSPDQPARVWVAGCSTGEEAYSLGILLLEHIAATRRRMPLQIFATDIDDHAMEVGRAAVFRKASRPTSRQRRLQKFFIRDDGHFKVAQGLREVVIFSHHDLLHDPPFSRLDLVSCRNLLIYLRPEAQRHALTLLTLRCERTACCSWARRSRSALRLACSSPSTRSCASIGVSAPNGRRG